MADNKDFFDKIAYHILNECDSDNDFIQAYESINDYMSKHNVSESDKEIYIKSGAAEFLMMNTIEYRSKEKGDS